GRHQSLLPLGLHVPGGALLLLLTTTRFHGPLIWIGVAAVLAASAWNVRLEYAYWHRDPEIEFSRAG
ncbi:MAG: hypothetical protein V3S29_03740, partial [bacterium]